MFDNFELYITQTNKHDFLANIISDNNLTNFIIENKLFWKYFQKIRNKYGQDVCCKIIKILCTEDKENKFLTSDIYIMFEYNYFEKDTFESIFKFFKLNDSKDLNNLIEYCLINKCSYINYEFIEYLLNSKYKNIVVNNCEKILDNCYCLLDLKKIIKDKKLLERYNNYINKKPNNIIYEI